MKKTPSRPKKLSAPRKPAKKPAKKLVIRVELPPITTAQRSALDKLFETAAISVLGIPSGANINKMSVVPSRSGRRTR